MAFPYNGTKSIAIGTLAGSILQGTNAIAIGYAAGQTNQHASSIILNATGSVLNSAAQGALYISPIRTSTQTNVLGYDTINKEITSYSVSSFNNLSSVLINGNSAGANNINMNGNNLINVVDITGSTNSVSIKPTTTATGYLNIYTNNYATIANGDAASLQFLATPSSPYFLGSINLIKNNATLTGSAYLAITLQNGSAAIPFLYGVPKDTLGNCDFYPPDAKINSGVLGGQWKSVGTPILINNDTTSDLSITASSNKWISFNTGGSNVSGTYPQSTSGSATYSVGWNFDTGAGETTFMNNYNGAGAFSFRQRTGASSSQLLARFNPSEIYAGNAYGSFLTQTTNTSIYSAGTVPTGIGVASWNSAGFTVIHNSGTTGFTGTTSGLGFAGGATRAFILALQPNIVWKELNIGALVTNVYNAGILVAYTAAGGWVNVSDSREKENIDNLNTANSLQKVLACTPKHFTRKYPTYGTPVSNDIKSKVMVGLLAQDILVSNPDAVSTWEDMNVMKTQEDDGMRYGISYNDYIIHLIGAVKEQQAMISTLQSQVATLQSQVATLMSQ